MNLLLTPSALLLSSLICTSSAQVANPVGALQGQTSSPRATTSTAQSALIGSSCYQLDQGTVLATFGLTSTADLLAMSYFTAPTGADTITEISATFGAAFNPGNYSGGALTWALFDDPTNDSDPTDAVLLYTGADTANPASIDSGVFQSHAVPNIAVSNGFFVGVVFVQQIANEAPAPRDLSVSPQGKCWAVGSSSSSSIDLNDLTNNSVGPYNLSALGFSGALMLRANGQVCDTSTGTPFCFGDGSGTACPCGQNGNGGEGCANSSGVGGATLCGIGVASITNDNFRMEVSGVPGSKPGLILRGMNQINGGLGNPIGDGLLCVGGATARSQVQFTNGAGAETFLDFQALPFGASTYGAGNSTNYVFWYRDQANSCSGSGFNFSNAVEVVWQP